MRRLRRRPATSRSVAVAAVTVTTAGVLPVYLVGVLAVQVKEDLGFGPAVLGLLAALFFATSAVASLGAGTVAKRWASATVMRASALMSAAALLIIALLARDVVTLSVALVLGGWANGAGQPASNAMIAAAVSERRQGLAFGAKQAAIPLSTLLAGAAIPLIAIPFGWPWAFGLAGALALLVAAAVPGGPSHQAGVARTPSVAAGPFRLAPLLVLSAGVLLAAGSGNALGAFFVTSAVASGVAPSTAGLLAAGASLGGVVTRILLGWLADRLRARWLIVVAAQMAVGAVGYALLGSGRPGLMAAGALLGYCSGWAWAGLLTYAVARMHFGMTARATGITQGALGLGSALGPVAFGAAVVATSYPTAWYATAVLSMTAAVVITVGRHMLMRERPALVAEHRQRRRSSRLPSSAP